MLAAVWWSLAVLTGVLFVAFLGYAGYRLAGAWISEDTYTRENASSLLVQNRPDDWNAFRDADADWSPVLNGVSLAGANLNGANLRRAALDGADFRRASLENADFTEASLVQANLSEASLSNATLDRADCRMADFSRADIAGASFVGATLEGTGLKPEPPSVAVPEVVAEPSMLATLTRYPDKLFALNPAEFEEVVAELLRHQGYDVQLSARKGDGGVDVVAERGTPLGGQERILVEAKRYGRDRRVGVEQVRALLGVTELTGASAGLLVTTSGFTAGAAELASRAPHRLTLAGYDDLLGWLREAARQAGPSESSS